MIPRWWLLLLACAAVRGQTVDPDTDGDGLSDFQEIHKYLTDPAKKDTDGDGIPDGDWKERREYAYTVRSLLIVMRPAEVEAMNDDFQDARLVEDHGSYVCVEVIHYPLCTASETIAGNPRWRAETASMRRFVEPGQTANWDDGMRRAIVAGLGDVSKLDDKQLVEKAAPWLLERARYEDGFTTFFTAFEGSRAFVPAELRSRVDSECRRLNRTFEEEWNREIFAKGMFENEVRGSCTSTAIYMNGCLRALGIPTRIVLAIPVIDTNDASELAMVRENVSHHAVRRTILAGLGAIPKGSWTSHTFNEVWVGGRWRRLNGDRLGQPTLDEHAFGLMTHVATVSDWADAKAWETIGKRQAKTESKDVFGGPNPYSASAIDDSFGAHCKVANPKVEEADTRPLERLTIDLVVWSDDASVPKDIRDGMAGKPPVLLAHVVEWKGFDAMKAFTKAADPRFSLEAEGRPKIDLHASTGGVTNASGSIRWVVIAPSDNGLKAEAGVSYALRPRNEGSRQRWIVADTIRVTRN